MTHECIMKWLPWLIVDVWCVLFKRVTWVMSRVMSHVWHESLSLMWCLMCHSSRVTSHVTCVTWVMSRVMSHVWHESCHESLSHVWHESCHKSCHMCDMSPVWCDSWDESWVSFWRVMSRVMSMTYVWLTNSFICVTYELIHVTCLGESCHASCLCRMCDLRTHSYVWLTNSFMSHV